MHLKTVDISVETLKVVSKGMNYNLPEGMSVLEKARPRYPLVHPVLKFGCII